MTSFIIHFRAIKHLTCEVRIEAANEEEARRVAVEQLNNIPFKWDESEPEDQDVESITRG